MDASGARAKAEAARAAALRLQGARDAERRGAVEALADLLLAREDDVAAVNAADVRDAEAAVATGDLDPALLKRLTLDPAKLRDAARGAREVAALPDPLGRVLRHTLLDDGLTLQQVTVPLGVVACAFESRPDAAVQVASLAMRTGNAVILKGGHEADRTNRVIVDAARAALAKVGLPEDAVALLEGRAELRALLDLDDVVDLVIPRGSAAFVRFVQDHTRIPVLGHADGVCHVYVDAAADLGKALDVCLDAKVDYPAACNAAECFLVHRAVAAEFLPRLGEALRAHGVDVRADAEALPLMPGASPASEADWGHEFGTLACAVKVVADVGEAVAFVNVHGSGHTDAILTEEDAAASRFVEGVDSAGVFVNASTRFADGYRYGLGAEVGISTGKVHARGPVGLDGLTTTKWVLRGAGHVAADYQGPHARPFRHEDLREGSP